MAKKVVATLEPEEAPVEPKPAPKPPRVSISSESKKELVSLAKILVKHYGPNIFPNDLDPVTQLVFAILQERAPVTNVKKAIRSLRDDHVDWNETRIATLHQITRHLEATRIAGAFEAATRIRSALRETFNALYTLDFSCMARDEAAKMRLEKHEELSEHLKAYVRLTVGEEPGPPLDPVTTRVFERVGLFAPQHIDHKRRKLLAVAMGGPDALRFHHLLLEHGKKLCTEKAPKCAKCPIKKRCAFGKAGGGKAKKGAARGKASAPKRAVKKAAPKEATAKKVAPKKVAPKKVAPKKVAPKKAKKTKKAAKKVTKKAKAKKTR